MPTPLDPDCPQGFLINFISKTLQFWELSLFIFIMGIIIPELPGCRENQLRKCPGGDFINCCKEVSNGASLTIV